MLRLLLCALALIPGLAIAQGVLSNDEARKAEVTLAEWLAHPMEFGVKPKRTKYLTYHFQTRIAGSPQPVNVHIIEYEMPNGTYGRGFVNPVTWSFLGPLPYDKLTDVQLVTAYSGWLWIFSALNNGSAQETNFEPQTLTALLKALKREGTTGVSFDNTRSAPRNSLNSWANETVETSRALVQRAQS